MHYATLRPVMPMPTNIKHDTLHTLHNLSTFQSQLHQKASHTKLFISHLFCNNGSILTPSMISHS